MSNTKYVHQLVDDALAIRQLVDDAIADHELRVHYVPERVTSCRCGGDILDRS